MHGRTSDFKLTNAKIFEIPYKDNSSLVNLIKKYVHISQQIIIMYGNYMLNRKQKFKL